MAPKQDWIAELLSWTDENHISAEKLPRDEETLLSQTALNLSFCKLTQLPESLANLTHLTELDLAYNALTELPEWIDSLTALEKLDVSGNSITSLPDSLRHLPNLEIKGLDKQIKKGEKMAQKSNLPFLQSTSKQRPQVNAYPMPENTDFLDEIIEWADKNNIENCKVGDVGLPRDKEQLFKTNLLALFCNELSNIPAAICNLINLSELDLSDNKLNAIPESIGNLTNLVSLNLCGNNLVRIPESISNLHNLRQLFLENNELTELPESIGNLVNLVELHLQNHDEAEWKGLNKLSTLPKSIGNLKNLTSLQLYNNQLVELPESIENLTNLTSLQLYNNQLTKLPESIGNLRNLTSLHLRNNQLTEIPESIKNLTKLSELNLRNNCLTQIPDSVQKMRKLKIIGLEKQLSPPFQKNKQLTQQPTPKINMKTYEQKILFGSPGTGKSYKIDGDEKSIISQELRIQCRENVIKTVFHPEYTYGDFVGKLVPITPRSGGSPQYNFYEGHFLKALSQAYKNIIAANDKNEEIPDNVALVIDEINRGNSAAIFGTIFQLLDREKNGWSSYDVNINEITFNKLTDLIGLAVVDKGGYTMNKIVYSHNELHTKLKNLLNIDLDNQTIKIPPNLSILASMNTSDSSIYYMDSAFKRRWDWEFVNVKGELISDECKNDIAFGNEEKWRGFVDKLNTFIRDNHKSIRGIEDKQVGYFFISDKQIQKSSVQNKLMFFLWDSVFNRDKKPLIDLLFGKDEKHDESPLITFGDFAVLVDEFIDKINNFKNV